jgi:hypothetical protein
MTSHGKINDDNNTHNKRHVHDEDVTSNNNNSRNSPTAASPNSRQELARRLYCPEPKVNAVEEEESRGIESSLSAFPWKLRCNPESIDKGLDETTLSTSSAFLPVSYLELRRQQNIAFADEKYKEATSLLAASSSTLDFKRVETIFQQALELVPDHLDSLIGYGKLLVRSRTHWHKAQRIFQDAVDVDPNNVTAQQYLSSIDKTILMENNQQQQQQRESIAVRPTLLLKKGKSLTARDSSAYQDALTERNLTMEQEQQQDRDQSNHPQEGEHDDDDDEEEDGRDRSRKRDRDRYRKRRKRRKSRNHKRNRNGKRKKHKHTRRRRYDSSSSSVSSSAISSTESHSNSNTPEKPKTNDDGNGEITTAMSNSRKSASPVAEDGEDQQVPSAKNDIHSRESAPLASRDTSSDRDREGYTQEHRKKRRRSSSSSYEDRERRRRRRRRHKHKKKRNERSKQSKQKSRRNDDDDDDGGGESSSAASAEG